MTKGIKRRINFALIKIKRVISDFAQRGPIAGALAGESYAGGYRDALYDVTLLLNGVEPSYGRGYWRIEPWTDFQAG